MILTELNFALTLREQWCSTIECEREVEFNGLELQISKLVISAHFRPELEAYEFWSSKL